jgi:glucosamine-phosphate N-acetyltransferase
LSLNAEFQFSLYIMYVYCNILELNLNEIKDDYLELLSYLTDTPPISLQTFVDNIHEISNIGRILVCHQNNKIVGTATILYEPKIIHGGKSVGHIEDVVVNTEHRGHGIASELIRLLIEDSKQNNCYKVILDCKYSNIEFYEKNGLTHHGAQMAYYLP